MAWKIAQFVKFLFCQNENMNSAPEARIKMPGVEVHTSRDEQISGTC